MVVEVVSVNGGCGSEGGTDTSVAGQQTNVRASLMSATIKRSSKFTLNLSSTVSTFL